MSVVGHIKPKLRDFFKTDEGKKYVTKIISGKKHVIINMDELFDYDALITPNVIDDAARYGIEALEEALSEAVHIVNKSVLMDDIEVGFSGNCIPIIKCHEIGASHIGRLVRIKGLVNQTHFVKPMAIQVVFKCRECGEETYPILQESPFVLTKPRKKCDHCNEKVAYDIVQERSIYIDSQDFSIQELHEDISGRIPQRMKMFIFKKYLINKVYCGDSIEIFGVVKVTPRHRRGQPLRFNDVYVEVYSLEKHNKDPESMEITPDEEKEIIRLSKQPDIYEKLVNSLAPSLCGMIKCKKGCLMSLFGGVTKHKKDITVRGNIHVLFVGDPSTAKSQLLRTVADLSPRGMYSSGQGISGVGLTAALTKDEGNGEWMINAGILVLADKGVACIDEIDKMRPEDRVNIHEAMAQQRITISKAGLHNTLMARTSVIAAANPAFGRYDESRSVFENLSKFPPTLFSRFDLIFVLIDKPEDEKDERVLSRIEGEEIDEEVISRNLLKKYIAYAKRVKPKVSLAGRQRLRQYFLGVRRTIRKKDDANRIPITYRQYEALLRLCEAHARIFLRDVADLNDVEATIDLFNEFLHDIDFDLEAIETGKTKSFAKVREIIFDIVKTLQSQLEYSEGVPLNAIITAAGNKNIANDKAKKAVVSIYNEGMLYFHTAGNYRTSN